MKKLLTLLIILFVLFLSVQFLFNFFGKGATSEYKIDGFKVKEIFSQNNKNEIDNYYFEISNDDVTFNFQVFDNLNRNTRVIKEIKHFKNDNYECIYPIFKDGYIHTDVICKGDYFYDYQAINGYDNSLDEFVSNLKEYDSTNFLNSDEYRTVKKYKIYSNLKENHYIAIENYTGLFLYNQNAYEFIKLFDKDIYNKPISTIVSKYYVVADYNQDYDFHKFYIVDLEIGSVKEITSDKSISLDSYIQGVVDNEIYLFDRSNKKQYEINIKTKTIIEVGNESSGIKIYKDNEWTTGNVYDAINNKILFNEDEVDNTLNGIKYDRIDKYGNNLSGYYYLYKKTGSKYKVYRANIANTANIKYLFETDNIDHIIYEKDFVYFKDNGYIKSYNQNRGVRNIIYYNELAFNNNINIYLHAK